MKKIIISALILFLSCAKSERSTKKFIVEKVEMKSFFEASKRDVESKALLEGKSVVLKVLKGKSQRNFLAKLLYSQNKKKPVRIKYEKSDNVYLVEDVMLLP